MNDVHPELKRKWLQIFMFFKGDRDGDLSIRDFEKVQQKFLANDDIPLKKRKETAKMFNDVWTSIHGDSEHDLTQEEFLSHSMGMMTSQAGTMALSLVKLYKGIFYCVDFNDDNCIEMDEFLVYSKAAGLNDETVLRKIFMAIDTDGNGTISQDEYVNAYIRYEMDANVKLEDLPIYGLPKKGN